MIDAYKKFDNLMYLLDQAHNLSVGDNVYVLEHPYDRNIWKLIKDDLEIVTYKIRSINISCNSKEEWKISYRVQKIRDGKIVDYGFNFSVDDIYDRVFLTIEEAENKRTELLKDMADKLLKIVAN